MLLCLAHWKCLVVEGEMKKAHLAVTPPRPLGVQMCVCVSIPEATRTHGEQPPQNINIQRTELEGAISPKIKRPQAFCGPLPVVLPWVSIPFLFLSSLQQRLLTRAHLPTQLG